MTFFFLATVQFLRNNESCQIDYLTLYDGVFFSHIFVKKWTSVFCAACWRITSYYFHMTPTTRCEHTKKRCFGVRSAKYQLKNCIFDLFSYAIIMTFFHGVSCHQALEHVISWVGICLHVQFFESYMKTVGMVTALCKSQNFTVRCERDNERNNRAKQKGKILSNK